MPRCTRVSRPRTGAVQARTGHEDTPEGAEIDPREGFNDGIERLVARAVEDEPLSDETLRRLDEADIGAGRFRLLGDVLRNPGILE